MAQPLQAPPNFPGCHRHGQVEVAVGVAIAEDVLLAAAPGCRLIISPGVCVGSAVIIQAQRGDLLIEPGANLGSGVLVIGRGCIGQQACVGAESTLIDPEVAPGQVVPPRSLWGDPSQTTAPTIAAPSAPAVPPEENAAPASAVAATNGHHPEPSPFVEAEPGQMGANYSPETAVPATGLAQPSSPVYGQQQVQALLDTLFPHRRGLNGVPPGDKP